MAEVSQKGNAIVYYQSLDYSTSAKKLMGRNAASEAFLKAWMNHAPFDEIVGMVKSEKDARSFVHFFKTHKQWIDRNVKVCGVLDFAQLKQSGCLYVPDPNLILFANQRSRVGRYHYSLCGITHTIASIPTMEMIASYLSAPIYPWDALICTSKVVQDAVMQLFKRNIEFLSERFGTKLRLALPQLPVLPLGVELDTTTMTQRQALKVKWRKGLKIQPDTVVFLFFGRLSFHAKANPIAMYRALQAVAEKSDKKIALLHVGWFANESIETTFRVEAHAWAPDVASYFIDGRKEEVRSEIRYACDVFISLSDNIQETFGLTPIEAMASGLPTVVSDWNGYKDTVRHGVDGFRIPTMVPSYNEAHLPQTLNYEAGLSTYDVYIGQVSHTTAIDIKKCTEACLTLVEHPELRVKFGNQARARVESEFSWTKVIHQYVTLFRELHDIRIGNAKLRKKDQVHPAHRTPFETFPTYPTQRLSQNDGFFKTSKNAEAELVKLMQSPMFNYGGLEAVPLMNQILKVFSCHQAKGIKDLPQELGSAVEKEKVLCFLLKVGLIEKA